MTIEKGQPWGSPGHVPGAVIVAPDDAAVAGSRGMPVQPTGGNLWRSLGCPSRKATGEECTMLPVDAIKCTVTHPAGTTVLTAVADVRAGGWFRRTGLTVVTNVGIDGNRNLAPRAHPNDGELDVLEVGAATSFRQRFIARRRALTGTHVPHPTITVHRARTVHLRRRGRERLVIDGRTFGKWQSASVELISDHITVIV